MSPQIRVLDAADAPAYRAVRFAALQNDPAAFVTTAAEFAARSLASVAAGLTPGPDNCTFGAFLNGGELVGILTLSRETRAAIRHRGTVTGVAVLPQSRGQSCGDALMRSALDRARGWEGVTSLHLAVTETQHAARRLYERHGFRVWGTQPDALRHESVQGGRALREDWLWLPLTDMQG